MGFPGGSVVKNTPANAGDVVAVPGSGSPPGEGNGDPLQHSCLGNPMDRGAWRAKIHMVSKSWTRLSTHAYIDIYTCVCVYIFFSIVGY